MAADRRQRRPQLARDGHQELPRQLLRLGQLRRHVGESRGELRELVGAARLGHLDPVVAAGDLVGRRREREQWSGDPPREVEAEQAGDEHAPAEGDREPLDQHEPAAAELGVRLRDDERAEHLVADLQRLGDCEIVDASVVDVERPNLS